MNCKLICIFIVFFLCAGARNNSAHGQVNQLDHILNELQKDRKLRLSKKLVLHDSLLRIASLQSDECQLAKIWISRAILKDREGEIDSAIYCLVRADELFSASCDSSLFAELCNVNSAVNLSLGNFEKADSLAEAAIRLWKPAWSGDEYKRKVLFSAYSNKAIAVASTGNIDDAMMLFEKTLSSAIEFNDSLFIEKSLINKGTIASMTRRFDEAEGYYLSALSSALQRNEYSHIIECYLNLSGISQEKNNLPKAIEYLQRAASTAEPLDLLNRKSIEKSFAVLFEKSEQWEEAYIHRLKYEAINDSILNQEIIASVSEMEEKYQSEKRIREIQDLKVSNLDNQLESEKNKRARNAMIAGAAVLFVSLIFLFARYRFVQLNRNKLRRKNEIIEIERKRSDDLLKNILPEEVAEELKAKGEAQAVQFDMVTVLFTDFKGFTAMSERMSAQDLVRDLNECFSAFDLIAEKYGIEKIKTIGDAYMAAGGLPLPNKTHAADVVGAAFEMRNFIDKGKARKIAADLPYFEIRIGIHTGPVVAGIVGVKKFQYDIWGDTVNTASCMESSGEVDRVNISEYTYDLIKSDGRFKFESRGLVAAKGKGNLQMYFVEDATR